MLKRISFIITILTITSLTTACNTIKPDSASIAAPEKSTEIDEVHKDGRIFVFYDRALYKEYLSVGETVFRLTQIGQAAIGETMVFGLTKKDKKKGANTLAVNFTQIKQLLQVIFMVKHFVMVVFMFSTTLTT